MLETSCLYIYIIFRYSNNLFIDLFITLFSFQVDRVLETAWLVLWNVTGKYFY